MEVLPARMTSLESAPVDQQEWGRFTAAMHPPSTTAYPPSSSSPLSPPTSFPATHPEPALPMEAGPSVPRPVAVRPLPPLPTFTNRDPRAAKPKPTPLTIPTHSSSSPRFSAYPFSAPGSPSSKGKERETTPLADSPLTRLPATAPPNSSLQPPSHPSIPASSSQRRSSQEPTSPSVRFRTPSSPTRYSASDHTQVSHLVAGQVRGYDSEGPNPLAHTWGQQLSLGSERQSIGNPRRRRANSMGQQQSGFLAPPSSFPLRTGSPTHRRSLDRSWKSGGGRGAAQLQVGGSLPPGALPAVDPASGRTFELSPASRYALLSGSQNSTSTPLGVIPVPRRESSLSDHYDAHEIDTIRGMGSPTAFTYGSSPNSRFTIQAVSTLAKGRPLVSPTISQRRSSITQDDFFGSKPLSQLMSDLEHEDGEAATPRTPMDSSIVGAPHASALLREARSFQRGLRERDAAAMSPREEGEDLRDLEKVSVPSMTDDSSHTESPRQSPFTSASNSLSRSTKSKEGEAGVQVASPETDATSLSPQAEPTESMAAKLAMRLRKADRRKCVLTELIETEVAFRGHLRDLVEVYSPQLAVLSAITPDIHSVIMRNVSELLALHETLCSRMLEIAVEERLGSDLADVPEQDDASITDRLVKRLAELFVEVAPEFWVYEAYCMEAAAAMDAIRAVQHRAEWAAFEKRCQTLVGSRLHLTLHQALAEGVPGFSIDALPPPTLNGGPSRLFLRDLLILPIQKLTRYPFMLGALSLVVSAAPSPAAEQAFDFGGNKVEKALTAMRRMAAKADEANEMSIVAMRTAHIQQRLEPHAVLDANLISSLGPTRLVGALEVLYHHPAIAPLVSPVKVKYLVGLLYDGYLILAKVKKTNVYEIKHYLALEMFELIDVTAGFLPHSIRLQLQQHTFELVLTGAKEKDVWADALCSARDTISAAPFSRPCSVIINTNRSRRKSTMTSELSDGKPSSATQGTFKRNSMFGGHMSYDFSGHTRHESLPPPAGLGFGALDDDDDLPASPTSPTSPTFPRDHSSLPSEATNNVLLRRATPAYQSIIDGHIADVCSEKCLTARTMVSMGSTSPRPRPTSGTLKNRLSMRDSSLLRRRGSYVFDVRTQPSSPEQGHAQLFSSVGRRTSAYTSNRSSVYGSVAMKRGDSVSGTETDMEVASPTEMMSGSLFLEGSASGLEVLSEAMDTAKARTLRANQSQGSLRGKPERRSTASRLVRSHPPTPRVKASDTAPSLRHQTSMPKNLAYTIRPRPSRSLTLPSTPRKGSPKSQGSAPSSGMTTPSSTLDDPNVFMLGAGLTNTPTAVSTSSSSGGLTRTFSQRFLKRDSLAESRRSLGEFGAALGLSQDSKVSEDNQRTLVARRESPREEGQRSSPASDAEQSNGGASRRSSAYGSEGDFVSTPDDAFGEDTNPSGSVTPADGEERPERPDPLKRRRSVKFFQSLNRLTSINTGRFNK